MGRTGAIVVAAGKGQRFGADKVFAPLGDRPVLAHAAEVFQLCPLVDDIVLVLARDNLDRAAQLVGARNWTKVSEVCAGGARRQDSVREGLVRLGQCEWVVVHDGVRPFVTAQMIEEGLSAAKASGAAIAAVPVKDTVKLVNGDEIVEKTLDRHRLRLAQTPQVFRRDLLVAAYAATDEDVTDDAMLLERSGVEVAVYPGSYENIKITTPEDLEIARFILGKGSIR